MTRAQGQAGNPDPRPEVDRPDYDPHYRPRDPVLCDVCGAGMIYTAACKLRCLRCGYTRDCSDP
jgi:hypothetical protein